MGSCGPGRHETGKPGPRFGSTACFQVGNQRVREDADLAHRLNAAQLDWMGALRSLLVLTDPQDLAVQTSVIKKAQANIATIENGLEMYRLETGRYPDEAEGLAALTAPGTMGRVLATSTSSGSPSS